MLLFPTYHYQSSPTTTMASSPQFSSEKPKGIWKVRGTQHPRLDNPLTPTTVNRPINIVDSNKKEETTSGDICDSSLTFPSKESRTALPSEEIRVVPLYWDYSHICCTQPDRLDKWKMGAKFLDTSAIVGSGQAPSNESKSFDLEDWKDLRTLATEAKEVYDDHDLSSAIEILRGVMHECHRYLKIHPDPSVVFAAPLHKKKAEPPPQLPTLPVVREWFNDPNHAFLRRGPGQPVVPLPPPSPPPEKEECLCVDLPTAFHTILGTALFMFGCIIESNPSLAIGGEPKTPTPYWLSAVDVFETGESLPIRTSGRVPKSMPEDWRMSASWGRTLVRLAIELLKRRKENPALREPPPVPDYSNFKVGLPSLPTPFRTYTADEPEWPRASLFATICFLRPPSTRRLSLDISNPDELMAIAEDHLTRAIFHMPHPRNVIPARYPYHPLDPSPAPTPAPLLDSELDLDGPDRPQEIYTMASEMLVVAENSETSRARFRWARWADGVISQVTIQPDMKPQKFLDLRAKCNLAMGTAKMEELLEDWDYPNVLNTEDAEDGRKYLRNAATFFEQAIALIEQDIENTDDSKEEEHRMEFDSEGSDEGGEGRRNKTPRPSYDKNELEQMKTLRSEALIELGNLTADFAAREELYAEAKRVGGKKIVLDDEHRLDETADSIYDDDDQMDETE